MSDRSTAQALVFATLSFRTRRCALQVVEICAALLCTQASCRDVEADHGYCLTCQSDLSSATATAGDGSAGATMVAANGGGGGETSTNTSSVAAGVSNGASGVGGRAGGTVTSPPSAAVGGSVPRAGTGAAGMSTPVTSAAGTGGRGGASMSMAGRSSEPPEPCGGRCSGDRSVCADEVTGCVACTVDDTHACPRDKLACDSQNNCQACVSDANCPSDKPVCDLSDYTCIECDREHIGACGGDKPVCDTSRRSCVGCTQDDATSCGARVCEPAKQVCVDCLTSEQCGGADMARCDNNTCSACVNDGDCSHLLATPVCDAASHRCVECAGNRGCIAPRVCGQGNACMDGSTQPSVVCQSCSNDGTCPTGTACVAFDANGRPAGMACLAPKPMNLDCDSPPFTRAVSVTLSGGARGDYCAPPASCGTVNALGQPCAQGTNSCGDPTLRDGTCLLVTSQTGTQTDLCTYRCTRTNDCAKGSCTTDGLCQVP